MENNNGCKAKIIITVGSLSITAGKVWLQDTNGDEPVWERSFDKLNHATGFLCEAAFPKNVEQSG